MLAPLEELALVGRLEVLRRRLDHGTDRAAGHLDRSAAFSLDGHKSAKGALKATGRMSGSEAFGRVQTARALRQLPLVEAAYARGEIPTEHVPAIARAVSTPGCRTMWPAPILSSSPRRSSPVTTTSWPS